MTPLGVRSGGGGAPVPGFPAVGRRPFSFAFARASAPLPPPPPALGSPSEPPPHPALAPPRLQAAPHVPRRPATHPARHVSTATGAPARLPALGTEPLDAPRPTRQEHGRAGPGDHVPGLSPASRASMPPSHTLTPTLTLTHSRPITHRFTWGDGRGGVGHVPPSHSPP